MRAKLFIRMKNMREREENKLHAVDGERSKQKEKKIIYF